MGGVKLQKQRLYANSCLQRLEQIPEEDFDNIQVLLDEIVHLESKSFISLFLSHSILHKSIYATCPLIPNFMLFYLTYLK